MTAESKGNVLVLDGESQVLNELTRLLEGDQYQVPSLAGPEKRRSSCSKKRILIC